MPKLGKYRHYKGTEYEVLFIAKDSDSEEDVVVYQDIENPEKVWTRSVEIFTQEVEVDGKMMPRFTYLGSE